MQIASQNERRNDRPSLKSDIVAEAFLTLAISFVAENESLLKTAIFSFLPSERKMRPMAAERHEVWLFFTQSRCAYNMLITQPVLETRYKTTWMNIS